MYITTQRYCIWSGIAAISLFFTGLIIAQFFPPPSPSLSASEIASIYQQNANLIRIGMIIIMISGAFAIPPVAVIAAYVRRIEGDRMPAMTYVVLLGGIANVMFFILPALVFLVTAYRPDRPVEITMMMNDFSWIITVLPFPGALAQLVATAVAVLRDHEQTVLPRWMAYFSLWAAIGFLPASVLPFVKSGPFAWNGIFPFWIPATIFGAWYIVMLVTILKAIKNDEMALNANA